MIIVLVMAVVLSDKVATSGDHLGPRDIAEDAADLEPVTRPFRRKKTL